MTSMNMLESLTNLKGKYILEAHEELVENGQPSPSVRIPVRRKKRNRMALVVLVAVMMLMLMGCTFGLIKLFQMKLGDYPYREANVNGETEGKVSTGQFISLQGLPDRQSTWQRRNGRIFCEAMIGTAPLYRQSGMNPPVFL